MKPTQHDILNFLQEIKPSLLLQGIEKIALFGSFAREDAGVYSDIDIAIQKEPHYLSHRNAYDYFALVNSIKTELRKRFGRNSDIFDLDSSSPFKSTIIGELIYV